MPGGGRPLPTFPCMCKAIYSWGGETKRDLGFVEGDLIECLNAGDGQWWMGRLRRNKAVGLFPSNYVEVLENYQRPGIHSRPASRAASPSMLGPDTGRKSRAASPTPSHRSRAASPQPRARSRSPQPPQHRSPSPQPPPHRSRSPRPRPHASYDDGSSRSRTRMSPSPPPHLHHPHPQRHHHQHKHQHHQHHQHQYQQPSSRAASPNPYRAVSPSPYSRATSPAPFNRSVSPAPFNNRSVSPAPFNNRSVSPAPFNNRSVSPAPFNNRSVSPAPFNNRSVSPAPSLGAYGVPRAVSPAPSHFRAVSPAPSMMRTASPIPFDGDDDDEAAGAPPAPPPHRVNRRAVSPVPPPHGERLTPNGSRAQTPSGQTPSPLRNAMEDVMESLQHMTSHDSGDRPRTPAAPWSPESFGEIYSQSVQSPSKRNVRPETSLGISRHDGYGREEEEDEAADEALQEQWDPSFRGSVGRMEDRLRRFQHPSQRHGSDDRPAKFASYSERPRTGDAALRNPKSAYDLRAHSASPSKMTRPRPLSRMGTLSSNSTSDRSSNTASTALTSATLMSGTSAGGLSATSAGSFARRQLKALSVIEGSTILGGNSPRHGNGSFGSRPETPSGYDTGGSGSVSAGSGPFGRKRGQTWNAPSTSTSSNPPSVFGGLAPPKPKKSSFFKKILNSAKTSAASVRSVAESPAPIAPLYAPLKSSIPDGITAIAGGRAFMQSHGQDWVQVRRDVNRANTLSRNERIERQEKQQMMDQPVLRPVDALEEDVDGNEAADGGVVKKPQDFNAASLGLVDKGARFISSLPPFTTPESLATHHVCRPYRSDVQRLRAIYTWVSEKIAWEHPSGPMDGEYGVAAVDSRRVLSQKRGSPEEVAVVVQGMCVAMGIHCDVVRGFLKAPGEALDIEAFPRANHWWNAVIADGEWRFMDCSLSSPTHPRRFMYSCAPASQAEFFYFLAKPSEFCWTHIPLALKEQHLVPPLPLPILLALPGACPTFFKNDLRMVNYDTSLIRIENLEVVQIEICVPMGVECVAEVEAKGFAVDQDGDVFETGEVVKKRALAQVSWENGVKTYRVKAVLPGDEGQGVLKVYAGKRGLMHSINNNPHSLALALPINHTGENPPFDFFIRHPTPHAQRHDLYVSQPQCAKLAANNTFVFAVRQAPSDGSSMEPVAANGIMPTKPAKLGIQTPSGKILRLMKKADAMGSVDGMIWETIIKCGERGPWRALVLADRSARWCVYGEWQVI